MIAKDKLVQSFPLTNMSLNICIKIIKFLRKKENAVKLENFVIEKWKYNVNAKTKRKNYAKTCIKSHFKSIKSQTLEQVQCDVSRSDGYDARMCGFDSTRWFLPIRFTSFFLFSLFCFLVFSYCFMEENKE